MGSSMALGICWMSQIKAWWSSPEKRIRLAHCGVDVTFWYTPAWQARCCFLYHYNRFVWCINLPAVQISQEECGAQAMPLTQARWLLRRATGVHGTLTSSIITWNSETCQDVNRHNVMVMVKKDYNSACCFMRVWNLLLNIKWNAGWGIQQSGPYRQELMWVKVKVHHRTGHEGPDGE